MGPIWLLAPMKTQWTSMVWCRGTRKWESALDPAASSHTWTGPQTVNTFRPMTAVADDSSTGCQVSAAQGADNRKFNERLCEVNCVSFVEVGRR